MKIIKDGTRSVFKKGFAFLEALLVFATSFILLAVIFVAVSPKGSTIDSRDAQRKTDVETIASAVYQYAENNKGAIPSVVTSSETEICVTTDCSGLVDFNSTILAHGEYLITIPEDPDPSHRSLNGSGYWISKDSMSKRITVSAVSPRLGRVISVTE